jgi:hypothetical protein
MYTQPDRFAMRHREPEPSYRHVYPSTVDIGRVAYFFDFELADTLADSAYEPLRLAVDGWSRAWREPTVPVLVYRTAPGFLQIFDGRHEETSGTYSFHDTLAAIYLACTERPTTARAVHAALDLPVRAVEDAFTQFHERGLMFLDGNLALALALPATPGR